jgi:hypothetical protein
LRKKLKISICKCCKGQFTNFLGGQKYCLECKNSHLDYADLRKKFNQQKATIKHLRIELFYMKRFPDGTNKD